MKNLSLLFAVLLLLQPSLVAQSSAGMALILDGNGDYMIIPDDSSMRPTESISVETWIRPSVNLDTTSSLIQFVTKNDASSSQNFKDSWDLWYQDGQVLFGFRVADSLANPLIATSYKIDLNANANYHLAGTYDKQNIKLYINGELLSTRAENRNIQNGTTEAVIGADSGEKLFFYNGIIDEVRIWNVARTQSQIQLTMYDTLSSAYYTSNDSGLIAYWRFDSLEDLGINSDGIDDVRDLSINTNHGDLEGNAILDSSVIFVSIEQNDLSSNINYFSLNQNYPNPFNPSTTIRWQMPEAGFVTLKIYDVLGIEVITLVNEELIAGSHQINFDASNYSSGIYFYQIKVVDPESSSGQSFINTKKMILLK